PNGRWQLKDELKVRGQIQAIIGCEATVAGDVVVRILDGQSPVIRIERIEVKYSKFIIRHESERTLVLKDCRLWRQGCYEGLGGGDLFVEDVAGDPWILNHQRAWFRQLNPESSFHPKIIANQSQVWILGLKTEGDMPALVAQQSDIEICGAFIYANTRRPKYPLLILDHSSSLRMTFGESSFRKQPFRRIAMITSSPIPLQPLPDWKNFLGRLEQKNSSLMPLPSSRLLRRGEGSMHPLLIIPKHP
ncbi:MAG: hypothetical protein D6820_03280, partial [Lentisphaerae bacterium]